ncbi:hypothetical protein WDU94_013744 [Cyamophila willieti]
MNYYHRLVCFRSYPEFSFHSSCLLDFLLVLLLLLYPFDFTHLIMLYEIMPRFIQEKINIMKSEMVEDDIVDNWFLMQYQWPVVTILVFYLAFVLKIGPNLMRDRKPMGLKYVMLAYNLFQTLFNAYIVSFIFIPGSFSYLYNHSCVPLPRQHNPLWMRLNEAAWYYYISKIVDLLDTIFFVLRKKHSHVSFLHLYHHTAMVYMCWGYLRYFKGEQGVFQGVLNAVVHVVMYSYYFLAALGPEVQKYLWWKRYITKFQLVQFVLVLIYALSLVLFQCQLPRVITYNFFVQSIIFVLLFGNFYIKTYIAPKPRDNQTVSANENDLKKMD